MKKLLLLAIALCSMTLDASAQKKHELAIGGTLAFHSTRNQSIVGGLDTELWAKDYTYHFMPSFEYFFKDRKSVELRFGYVGDQKFKGFGGLDNVEPLYITTGMFVVAPSVSWYVPLSEKLFYAPRLYMSYGWGQQVEEFWDRDNIKRYTEDKCPMAAFSTGFELARVEYKFNSSLSVSCKLGLGDACYTRTSIKKPYDSDDMIETINKDFQIGFNGITALTDLEFAIKYYF